MGSQAHKLTNYIKVKCGSDIEDVMKWASHQKKVITRDVNSTREVALQDVFGPSALKPVADLDSKNEILCVCI